MIEETIYSCDRCGKEFQSSQGLGGHKKSVHCIGLDELNGALKGEMNPNESPSKSTNHKDSLAQVKKIVEFSEVYNTFKGMMIIVAVLITIIVIWNKLSASALPDQHQVGTNSR